MKKLASLALSMFLVTGTAFADTPKDTPKETDAQPAKTTAPAKPAEKSNAEIAAQMEELRQALQAQQEQLQMLKEELTKRDRQIEEAREAAAAANARATDANAKASEAVTTTAEVKTTTAALNTTVSNMEAVNAAAVKTSTQAAAQAKPANPEEGPLTIRYKGVSITPGGFIAAETVNRHRAASADINTPFTSIPYPGNSLAYTSEFNASARQSRITTLIETKIGSAKVNGYYEADFLGAGTTSNNRESNSYVYRQRQIFGLVAFENGWSFTGGQMWTLATANRKGIVNRQENLPAMIDPQYVVGFNWERAYAIRAVKSFGGKFAVAASLEGPQSTIGGRGFSTYTTQAISATGALSVASSTANFWLNAPGNSGGLFNAFDPTGYTVNHAPDIIVKAAADPGFGHYELFGIVSFFRDRAYPCAVLSPTATTLPKNSVLIGPGVTNPACVSGTTALTAPSSLLAYNNSSTGGGLGGSVLLPIIAKKLDFTLSGAWGDGINRFGSAQLADATARPDGTLALLRGEQALGRLDWHPTPKWDFYAYFGNEYAWRAGYSGYKTVTKSNTPAIPPVLAADGTTVLQPGYPAITTYMTSVNAIGGYGNKAANNTGCSTELAPPATGPAGSGFPSGGGTCAGDVRNIIEGTLGFWYKPYAGPKGRLQMGLQYSYFEKWGWSGTGGLTSGTPGVPYTGPGLSPKAVDNMIWTSFRYYLP